MYKVFNFILLVSGPVIYNRAGNFNVNLVNNLFFNDETIIHACHLMEYISLRKYIFWEFDYFI